ncbi:replication factor C subunit 3/5 [Fonticula alba]|uniref:Replication factor C subunit 3/5 n=1 Tax=Fonticula alba TaxID=691883 RepID=A0A058Z822_FONAL|nr:replication factor C subunit 3/5 [Fonticula alba]KCV70048.1 replication factor C subunit 3/5 [Fonticula alba]|eukprot:XP_009495654.1 replication factor C subunit 3/5 [Fonticula alba]
MSLWVDRYRPTSLAKLDYHDDLTTRLTHLSASGDLPHLLVTGESGSGRKTRVMAMLREIFGPAVDKAKIDVKSFDTGTRKVDLPIVSSNYHLEMSPSDVGNQDRFVVQEVIKEVAQSQQIDANAARRFKVIVIHEADNLSRDAQAGLRRTMEKYTANLRLILVCNSTTRIIAPIRSRCLLVRVPSPSKQNMIAILTATAAKERHTLSEAVATNIVNKSDANLRRALLMLEVVCTKGQANDPAAEIPLPDWQEYIHNLADFILADQSPQRLEAARKRFYELLAHAIPASVILQFLAMRLMAKAPEPLQQDIIFEAAEFDHRIQSGTKAIFHLEAFTAKVMSLINGYHASM